MDLSFERGPIRPVAEANSLIIRVTRGCPWNRCSFCTSYKSKGIKFSIRSVKEVKNDIDKIFEAYKKYPFESCFLQDGDVFCMETENLLEILYYIKRKFPLIKTITSYGIIHNIVKKSQDELNQIYEAGLNRVYCGMESGSDTILKMIQKGTTADMQINAGKMLKTAGFERSYFIIMGIGGAKYSHENAIETAKVLNEINPEFIRVRTIRVKPESGFESMIKKGEYILPSEKMMIEEQLKMLELLNVDSYYSNDHSMNLMMEVEGQLPKMKNNLISLIRSYLDLSDIQQKVFNYGVRLFIMRRLSDLNDQILYQKSEEKMKYIIELNKGAEDEEILNYLRVKFTSS